MAQFKHAFQVRNENIVHTREKSPHEKQDGKQRKRFVVVGIVIWHRQVRSVRMCVCVYACKMLSSNRIK